MKGNYTEPRICTMVGRDPENPGSRQRSDRYEQMIELSDDVSNTLTSVQKDNLVAEPQCEPLRIKQATKQGYIEVEQGGVFDATYPDSTTRRGRVQEGGTIAPTLMASGDAPCRYEGVIFKGREVKDGDGLYCHTREDFYHGSLEGVSRSLKSEKHDAGVCVRVDSMIEQVAENLKDMATKARGEEIGVTINDKGSLRPHRMDKAKSGVSEFQVENEEDTSSTLISARPNMTYGMTTAYRIRKLTPRECFRLMGVCEADIDKIQASGVSNSQQYKMAGNSIVVDVLYHLFDKMFVNKQNDSQQLSLF